MNPLRPNTLTNMPLTKPNSTSGAIQKRSSGTLSSLQRNWSSNTLQPTNSAPPNSSQNQPPSSSQASWQATESDWPPSPPPKQNPKSALTMPYTNPVKSANVSGPVAARRANGSTRDSGVGLPASEPKTSASSLESESDHSSSSTTKTATVRTSTGFQANPRITEMLAKRAPEPKPRSTAVKRDFPWDVSSGSNAKKPALSSSKAVGSSATSTSIEAKNQLGNPKLSIAAKVALSKEQQAVLDSVLQGHSVFFTGSAGTGKSVLLRHIIAALKRLHSKAPDVVVVTASTGMAACAIGGTTIHSFAGIGLATETPDLLVSKVRKNRKAAARWLRTKVLIIDEISMVDGELFDKLAYIAQKLKRSDKPFGGIQLVIAGDFFQLPPVSKGKVNFAFNAKRWTDSITETVNLTQVFRQKDTSFIDMLNEMRLGALSEQSIRKFRELSREIKYSDGIMPTELYPTRQEVERSNSARLAALAAEPMIYAAQDTGKGTPEQRARDYANMMAVERLVLKKGAQVMMIKNQSSEDGPSWLVNGLVGKIEDFVDSFGPPDIHGGDDEAAFPPIRGTKGPTKVGSFKPATTTSRTILPLVAWCLPNGRIERTIVEPAEFKYENAEGEVQSRRMQVSRIM
ncbi:hypothetical protein CROQUDRAFT_654749, partial [Cronartium quercuum f. sp. fusiforme G11]